MAETITMYYAYRNDGRVREPLHADPNCHHLQRAAGTVRPVQEVTPVSRDVCGTCGGDVPVVDTDPDMVLGADGSDDVVSEATVVDSDADTSEESPADTN